MAIPPEDIVEHAAQVLEARVFVAEHYIDESLKKRLPREEYVFFRGELGWPNDEVIAELNKRYRKQGWGGLKKVGDENALVLYLHKRPWLSRLFGRR